MFSSNKSRLYLISDLREKRINQLRVWLEMKPTEKGVEKETTLSVCSHSIVTESVSKGKKSYSWVLCPHQSIVHLKMLEFSLLKSSYFAPLLSLLYLQESTWLLPSTYTELLNHSFSCFLSPSSFCFSLKIFLLFFIFSPDHKQYLSHSPLHPLCLSHGWHEVGTY